MIEGIKATEEIKYLASFTHTEVRKMGERDRWTCRGLDSKPCHYGVAGKPASFQTGYLVDGAHERDLHTKDGDYGVHKGRMLCHIHHAMEELQRGNLVGAEEILHRGIFHKNHLKEKHLRQKFLGVGQIFALMAQDGIPLKDGMELFEIYLPAESWQRISLSRQY